MKQQVEVTVKLALEADTEYSKNDITDEIQSGLNDVLENLNSVCLDILNIEVLSVKEEEEIYDTEPNMTYYLFGHEAVRAYDEGHMAAVKSAVARGDGAVYAHNEKDPSAILAGAMDGWHESQTITKEEYEELSNTQL